MAKQVVVRGATLKCSGSGPVSFLMVLPTLMAMVDGAEVATIDDHRPVVNIIPFGPCSFKGGQPCVPVTPSPWAPGEMTVQFGLRPVLDIRSHLKCELGGLITIQSSGQSNPFFAVDSEVSPLAAHAAWYEARMRYLEALREQFAAENEAEHVSGWDIARNTVKETAKEASGYNDAGRAIDAFGRGDIGAGLLSAGMAVPNPLGKVGKGVKAAKAVRNMERAGDAGRSLKRAGRAGKQRRLRQLGDDPKVSSAERGWIKQEKNRTKRGKPRKKIRVPPNRELAHERGREAAKGYGYEHAHLQDRGMHRRQHKYDNYGRKNKERPVK